MAHRPTYRVLAATLIAGHLCLPAWAQQIVDGRSANGLAYDLGGDGPVVVMIHGTNLDRRMWNAEAEWLGDHARVLRYDLRGQGDSDFPTDSYSNHDDLIDLMDELGLGQAVLLGLSAGTQVAVDVALAAPQLVKQLVLVSPSIAGYVPTEMPSFLGDLTASLRVGDFDQANEVLIASSIMAVPPEFAGAVREMVEHNDRLWTIPYSLVEQPPRAALEHLEDIAAPTLILVGENDEAAIREQGTLLSRASIGERTPDGDSSRGTSAQSHLTRGVSRGRERILGGFVELTTAP